MSSIYRGGNSHVHHHHFRAEEFHAEVGGATERSARSLGHRSERERSVQVCDRSITDEFLQPSF